MPGAEPSIELQDLAGSRVLVTGSAGFLGSAVRRELRRQGAEILGLDLRPTSGAESGGEQRSLDLGDRDALRRVVEEFRPDAAIHLAGALGGERSWDFAERALRANLMGTFALLSELCRLPSPPRIAIAGSSEEYGNAPRDPIDESCPDAPVSPYSSSKSMATRFALLSHDLWGTPVRVLRPFILYGPGQSGPMFIPSLLRALASGEPFPTTGGRQIRDFVFVDDAARAFVRSIRVPAASGRIFNVCSGRATPLVELVGIARGLPGARDAVRIGELPYRPNEAWSLVGDPSLARDVLGWSATTSLEEGLLETWNAISKGSRP